MIVWGTSFVISPHRNSPVDDSDAAVADSQFEPFGLNVSSIQHQLLALKFSSQKARSYCLVFNRPRSSPWSLLCCLWKLLEFLGTLLFPPLFSHYGIKCNGYFMITFFSSSCLGGHDGIYLESTYPLQEYAMPSSITGCLEFYFRLRSEDNSVETQGCTTYYFSWSKFNLEEVPECSNHVCSMGRFTISFGSRSPTCTPFSLHDPGFACNLISIGSYDSAMTIRSLKCSDFTLKL